MNKIIVFVIVIGVLGYFGYHYFKLDQNQKLQASLQSKDYQAAEMAIVDAVSTSVTNQAKAYFHQHNNYFVSTSNNICTSIQANFDVIKKIADNPIECHAKTHSFTARMKLSADQYLCVDQSGFSTIPVTDSSYISAVQCK